MTVEKYFRLLINAGPEFLAGRSPMYNLQYPFLLKII